MDHHPCRSCCQLNLAKLSSPPLPLPPPPADHVPLMIDMLKGLHTELLRNQREAMEDCQRSNRKASFLLEKALDQIQTLTLWPSDEKDAAPLPVVVKTNHQTKPAHHGQHQGPKENPPFYNKKGNRGKHPQQHQNAENPNWRQKPNPTKEYNLFLAKEVAPELSSNQSLAPIGSERLQQQSTDGNASTVNSQN